ncbi:MAG: radical SAM protein [Promethearchaeota archaeon]
MTSKPSFIHERNVVIKDTGRKFGLIFPSTYNIGMGGMTVAVLSEIVNRLKNWQFERFFIPWSPFVESRSIEHDLSLSQVDVIGFTAQFEVTYLALGWFLKKAGIPIDNLKRKKGNGKYPLVVIGGPCSHANPFPLIDIADGFFIGDAENSLPLFLQQIENSESTFWNEINKFQDVPGFWSPHFLDLRDKEKYSELFKDKSFEKVAGEWHSRAEFVNLNDETYPLKQIVTELPNYHPYAPFKGKAFQLEIGRGCDHGCRFCMVSQLLRKGRFRSYKKLLDILLQGMRETNVNIVDVFGTNLSDFPKLTELCWDIVNQGYEISLATLRPDKVNQDLLEALYKGGQRSITIATETGTERLRKVIGKPIRDEKIYGAIKMISESKIPSLKNFFLIGLPTETNHDREALVNMVIEEYKILSKGDIKKPILKVDVNPFIPKWQTPFKNYIYHFLPEHRIEFANTMLKIYQKFDSMQGIKPKQTSLSYSLAQTWITHLKIPINHILKKTPFKNHVYSTIYAPFFLYRFKNQLDEILKNQWLEFVQNEWKVNHPIKATYQDDEYFTTEYQKIFDFE